MTRAAFHAAVDAILTGLSIGSHEAVNILFDAAEQKADEWMTTRDQDLYHPATVSGWCADGLITGAVQKGKGGHWRFPKKSWADLLDRMERASKGRVWTGAEV